MNEPDHTQETEPGLLPDFCDFRVTFVAMVVAELVVVVIAFSPYGDDLDRWRRLSINSVFVQWIAIVSMGLLCWLRPKLNQLPLARALLASFLILLIVTGLASHAAFWLDHVRNLGLTVPDQRYARFILSNLAIAGLVGAAALRYLYIQAEWRRNIEARAEAQLQALQARIRPHFLFNSMNTIASLIRDQPETAEDAVEDLSDLFRAALGAPGGFISLETELDMTRRYIRIEKLRLGDRLRVEWDVGDEVPTETRVPPLIVQPLVENAIYHGIQQLAKGGTVSISASRKGNDIYLNIENPVQPDTAFSQAEGNRMAVDNIRERLRHAFGGHAAMHAERHEDRYQVMLKFPLRRPEHARKNAPEK